MEGNPQTTHDVPKCTCCGNIAPWEIEPKLKGIHWIIGIVLMIFGFFPGIVYLLVTFAIRSNPDHRAKICKKCKARNMFTFMY